VDIPASSTPITGLRASRSAARIPAATVLAIILCLPALIPLAAIVVAAFSPETEIWAHLLRYVLPEVIGNTLTLTIGVAVLGGGLGTALAWLTAMCEFPGRRFFEWALLLPLAIPAYVLAFVAVGFLDYSGPLQTWMRAALGSSHWMPPIRTGGGAIVVLSLATYPYVYLLARSAFLTQGRRALEAAQSLGLGRAAATWRVALPMARPWIAAGVALVCMETLADFGAVSVFNYNTFTTAIYRAWSGMFSVNAALELAGVLMVFVLVVLAIERKSRAAARFSSARDVSTGAARLHLRPAARRMAVFACLTTFLLAFALPFTQLLLWTFKHVAQDLDVRYFGFVARSVALAASAAVVIVAASVLLAYVLRRRSTPVSRAVIRVATMGYAIPGTVLAIGILVPVIGLNNFLQDLLRDWFGAAAPVLLLHGSLLTVLAAYLARFLAVGFNPMESGLQRITQSIDEAAVGLGVTGRQLVGRVHLPLLKTSLTTAATLVFVDVMKEMPITLITRPVGWETLATRIFEMTSEGDWERAALPAVAIVLAGLVPVALLTRRDGHVA
jgi:iron(III) transport system permease protein